MLTIADTHSEPDARAVAERFTRLFAAAAADGITLPDERELHAAFLSASVAGAQDRCRQMVEDAESRLGAARAARVIEEQRDAARREIGELRATYERHLSAITRTNGGIQDRMAQFAAAEAAGDVAKCRELAALAENAARAQWRRPEVIEAERQASQKAATEAYERDQERRRQETHIAELRQRCAQGWDLLGEIEKLGTVRLGEGGAVLYSGKPLGDDLMMALDWKAADVRNALRQRWADRVVIAALEPEAA